MVGFQTTLLEQLFDITQRSEYRRYQRIAQRNQLRLGLPPFEDRRPGRHWVFQGTSTAECESSNTTDRPARLFEPYAIRKLDRNGLSGNSGEADVSKAAPE